MAIVDNGTEHKSQHDSRRQSRIVLALLILAALAAIVGYVAALNRDKTGIAVTATTVLNTPAAGTGIVSANTAPNGTAH